MDFYTVEFQEAIFYFLNYFSVLNRLLLNILTTGPRHEGFHGSRAQKTWNSSSPHNTRTWTAKK